MTFHRYFAAGLVALALTGPQVSPAKAATPPPIPVVAERPPVPAENLAIAREIVALAWPPEAREATMAKLMASMMHQYRAGLALENMTDPGLRKILDDYLDSIPAILRPSVQAFLPRQMDAVATAYARNFSLQQLKDVRAFAQSSSGGEFLRRSAEVMSDPDVAEANTAYFREIQALTAKSVTELQVKVAAYIKAHPEARPKPAT